MTDIRAIEREERLNLYVFDLPIPVAVALVVGWILLCAATSSQLTQEWSLLEAFYFFFISLR
jgi:hypothetical protein